MYVPESQKSSSDSDETTSALSTLTRRTSITDIATISEQKKVAFKKAITNDEVLSQVKNFCINGWPANKNKIPDNIKHYCKLRNDLNLTEDLLLLNEKVIVPQSLRQDMLKLIYEGYNGIEKSKARARQVLYWPKMSQEIENHVKACKTCEKFSKQNTKEEMLPYQTPQRPWERVGADIFTYGNQSYLVVYDAYSNWLECNEIYHKSGDEVVKQLKLLFSRFGIPDIRNRKDLKLSLNQPTIQDEESFECLNPSSNKANKNTSNMRLGNIDPPLRHQPVTTRCGRVVKVPSRFKDYELQ
ncbi:Integrase zinc binding domain [Popillia japonica]|uniref:RNA-directed DNA polymerase n=1 Tax=Popillia japonica TaxID=7064 RepID=A0AAW1JG75_POPJA